MIHMMSWIYARVVYLITTVKLIIFTFSLVGPGLTCAFWTGLTSQIVFLTFRFKQGQKVISTNKTKKRSKGFRLSPVIGRLKSADQNKHFHFITTPKKKKKKAPFFIFPSFFFSPYELRFWPESPMRLGFLLRWCLVFHPSLKALIFPIEKNLGFPISNMSGSSRGHVTITLGRGQVCIYIHLIDYMILLLKIVTLFG